MLKLKSGTKSMKKVVSVVSVAALVLASTTMLASADPTTTSVDNPFLTFLNDTYNTTEAAGGTPEYNPFYNWDLDTSTVSVPNNDTYLVAASGGQGPLAAMLMSGKTGTEGVQRIVVVSQAAQDTAKKQTTLLPTAFSSISSAAQAWGGTGHGTLYGTNGATGLSLITGSGAQAILDKPEQTDDGEWMFTGEMDALGDNDVTDVPQGYMVNEAAYKQAVEVTGRALYPGTAYSTYIEAKIATFENKYDSYVTTAKNLVTASGTGSKRVLYVHSVTASTGVVRTAYSVGHGPDGGADDKSGYLITSYLTQDFGDANVGDSVTGQTGVTLGEDGKELLTSTVVNNIFSNAYSTTTQPQAIVFCNQGDETNFRALLNATNQGIFDTLKANGYISAAPVGMYDAALRSPDTALAPTWLAYVVHYGAGVNTTATSSYYTAMKNQAYDFYTSVYNFTPTAGELDNMYNPVQNLTVTY